jgi:hypothetical protein
VESYRRQAAMARTDQARGHRWPMAMAKLLHRVTGKGRQAGQRSRQIVRYQALNPLEYDTGHYVKPNDINDLGQIEASCQSRQARGAGGGGARPGPCPSHVVTSPLSPSALGKSRLPDTHSRAPIHISPLICTYPQGCHSCLTHLLQSAGERMNLGGS